MPGALSDRTVITLQAIDHPVFDGLDPDAHRAFSLVPHPYEVGLSMRYGQMVDGKPERPPATLGRDGAVRQSRGKTSPAATK